MQTKPQKAAAASWLSTSTVVRAPSISFCLLLFRCSEQSCYFSICWNVYQLQGKVKSKDTNDKLPNCMLLGSDSCLQCSVVTFILRPVLRTWDFRGWAVGSGSGQSRRIVLDNWNWLHINERCNRTNTYMFSAIKVDGCLKLYTKLHLTYN